MNRESTMRVKLVARDGCPLWMEQQDGAIWEVFREPNNHRCYQRTNMAWLCVPVAYANEMKDEGETQ